jgi:hypothetical protein
MLMFAVINQTHHANIHRRGSLDLAQQHVSRLAGSHEKQTLGRFLVSAEGLMHDSAAETQTYHQDRRDTSSGDDHRAGYHVVRTSEKHGRDDGDDE